MCIVACTLLETVCISCCLNQLYSESRDVSNAVSPEELIKSVYGNDTLYIIQNRQRQNETRSNAFGGQTQTHLHLPHPSNGGNSQALKA